MNVSDAAKSFLLDLDINLNMIADEGAQSLLEECVKAEEPIADRFDEKTLSALNRVQQLTYYKALDIFNQALRATLQVLVKDEK